MTDIDIGLLKDLLEDVESGRVSPEMLRRAHKDPYLLSRAFTEVKVLWSAPKHAAFPDDLSCALWREGKDGGSYEIKAVSPDWEGERLVLESAIEDGRYCYADGAVFNRERPKIPVRSEPFGPAKGDWFHASTHRAAGRNVGSSYALRGATATVLFRETDGGFSYRIIDGSGKDLLGGAVFDDLGHGNRQAYGVEGREHLLFTGLRREDGDSWGRYLVFPEGLVRLGDSDAADSFDMIARSVRMSSDGRRMMCRIHRNEGTALRSTLYLAASVWERPPSCANDHEEGVYGFLEDGAPFRHCRTCRRISVQTPEGDWVFYPFDEVKAIPRSVVGHGIGKPIHVAFENGWIAVFTGRGMVARDDASSIAEPVAFAGWEGRDCFAFVASEGRRSLVTEVYPVPAMDRKVNPYVRRRHGPHYHGSVRGLQAIPHTGKLVWIVSRTGRDGKSVKDEFLSVDGEAGKLHKTIHRVVVDPWRVTVRYVAEDDGGRLRCHEIKIARD